MKRSIQTVTVLAVVMLSSPLFAAKRPQASDAEIYTKAVQEVCTARIREIEAMMGTAKRSPRMNARQRKVAMRAKSELKRLQSDKPMPKSWTAAALRIEVNAPSVGQVGCLAWGELDREARGKDCTVKKVVDTTTLLAQTSWRTEQHAVARTWTTPSITGFAPSRKLSETHFTGPYLLFTNISTAGVRSGSKVKTSDMFVVEGQRSFEGETVFVLRRLEIEK